VFIGWFLILRFPRLWAPIDEVDGFEQVSTTRFWLTVPAPDDAIAERASELLRSAGARRVSEAML
jgi:hypothetical protein